ncbi:hypothetical protein, conserved [Plasmodium vivax]|nr:hypothetical protein, conserved [Plasmodium vivax]
MKSNEDISDNGCHDGLELKVNSQFNKKDKIAYEKMSSNLTTEKRRKNISYSDATDNKINNSEKLKTQKKGICCLCNTFKSVDSYYGKKIRSAFGISVENTKNGNMYVYNAEKMSFIKIFSLFLPYIILISIAVLIFFVEGIENHVFLFFFGLFLFMIFYILVKAIKYAIIQKKSKKKNINK